MGQETQLHSQLFVHEGELQHRLMDLLTRTLAGENLDVFDRSKTHPFKPQMAEDPASLEDLGDRIRNMRQKANVPLDRGFWAEYLDYCERARQEGMHAEQDLAREFLQSLKMA